MSTHRWIAVAALMGAGCSSDFQVAKGSAQLDVSPSLTDLGGVAVGATVDFDLTLVASDGDIQVVGVDVLNLQGDWFSLATGDPPLVGDGETGVISLSYSPTEEGYHWAQVSIETDESSGATHVVDVRGMAAEPAAQVYPSVLDFGPVRVDSTATGWFVVYNDGRVPIEIEELVVDNGDFSVVTEGPLTVSPGKEQVISLNFEPDDDSEATGNLDMEAGAVDLPTVTLRGNACSTASGELYDWDGDGFGYCGSDCNDWDADAHPGAEETCNGDDDDCDGDIDEGTSCVDDDGDGYSEDDGDCDDTYAWTYPGAWEWSDWEDNDCDGTIDEGTNNGDDDGDGFTENGGDCDDTDASANPGEPETEGDGVDNDCDGTAE